MQFTKETSKVLATIYKIYLERRKSGIDKGKSKKFNSSFCKSINELSENDVYECLQELNNAEFIKMDILGGFCIEDTLIIQMENRFKTGLSEVSKYLVDLATNLVPSLIF